MTTSATIEELSRLWDQPSGWQKNLLRTPTGQPKALLANVITALREAPEWQSVLGYDVFALTTMAVRAPPWLKSRDNTWNPQQWSDRDDVLATEWMHHQGIGVAVKVTTDAVETVAKDSEFHPVRDYLGGLRWDGTARLETFAKTYLGAADTPYHAKVGESIGKSRNVFRLAAQIL